RAEAFLDPEKGLKTIEGAFRQRSSPLAWLIRANARADRANDQADPDMAELAIQDANAAKQKLPGNPAALEASIYAHLAAAAAYEVRQPPAKARAPRDQAERDNRDLMGFLGRLPGHAYSVAWHFQILGRDDAAFDVLQQVQKRSNSPQNHALLALI